MLRRTVTSIAALTLLGCASAGLEQAREALRGVDGDVTVLAVFGRGEAVGPSLEVARRAREQVGQLLGRRARPHGEVRRAIAVQLEGASLLPERRREILARLQGAGPDPRGGLAVLRDHRAATVVDRELRAQARTLFLQAATEAIARGDREQARTLLSELRGWLSYMAFTPGELEVPSAVLALWREVEAEDEEHVVYRHALPLLSLLPHGQEHAALASNDPRRLAPDVVEQAARLGLALRLDAVVVAGVVDGEARAFVIDVLTRSVGRAWDP